MKITFNTWKTLWAVNTIENNDNFSGYKNIALVSLFNSVSEKKFYLILSIISFNQISYIVHLSESADLK